MEFLLFLTKNCPGLPIFEAKDSSIDSSPWSIVLASICITTESPRNNNELGIVIIPMKETIRKSRILGSRLIGVVIFRMTSRPLKRFFVKIRGNIVYPSVMIYSVFHHSKKINVINEDVKKWWKHFLKRHLAYAVRDSLTIWNLIRINGVSGLFIAILSQWEMLLKQ